MKCDKRRECGACSGCVTSYEQSLKEKEEWIKKLLAPYGKVNSIIGMDNPYHYRHKVHAVFGRDKKGAIVSGSYKEGTHRIIPIADCLIEDESARRVITCVEQLIKEFGLTVYDEDRRRGLIRHCVVRKSHKNGDLMVVIVTSSSNFPSRRNFVTKLLAMCSDIKTIVQSINDRDTTFVLGDREKVLYGPGFITDSICGCDFKLSPSSFYQINPVQTEVMYSLGIKAAHLEELTEGTCLDTYCGIGTIGIIAAKSAPHLKVTGVELNPMAVSDARKNATANKVSNIRFIKQDATRFMTGLAREGQRVDVVFMDPPRSGSTKEFFRALAKLAPKRVIYISCGPESLARDLADLKKVGYVMQEAWPVDNFGWTKHVETVVLMSKVK